MKLFRVRFFVGVVGLSLTASAVMAEQYDTTIFRGETPSKDEFINALTPDQTGGEAQDGGQILTRGLKVKTVSEPPKSKAADLKVNFEFGSFNLTPDAEQTLSNLGQALQSPELATYKFLIEGHTDSVGSAESNKRLSEQRAQAVKGFLVSSYGIEARRLTTIGRGEDSLLRPDDPASAENRRVQIVNVQ